MYVGRLGCVRGGKEVAGYIRIPIYTLLIQETLIQYGDNTPSTFSIHHAYKRHRVYQRMNPFQTSNASVW